MKKVVLILCDALRYDAAVDGMGYLGHLVESGLASLYKIIGELPSRSRPIYETIHTGLPTHAHGVVANSIVRLSTKPNIFRSVKDAGKTTAAAAYYWFSELYNRVPYDRIHDREVDDGALPIQHGRFYTEDDYPDLELFATAGMLVRRFSPDYLLLHPMGMDYTGERFGSDSSQYRNQAVKQDAWLAPYIVEWMDLGYSIFVTGDHGINKDGIHGGPAPEQREVPLYLIKPNQKGLGDTGKLVSHLQIAPTVLKQLDLPVPETMVHPPIS
jgi:predicted AlkP superfamily pyrophosphatase or phosphodiesterase